MEPKTLCELIQRESSLFDSEGDKGGDEQAEEDACDAICWRRPDLAEGADENLHRPCSRQSQQHGYCQWPLVLKDDGTLIGFCGFVPADGSAEIGWRLAFQHWGKGLATEAAQAILRYGFGTLGFERVTATVQSGNRTSMRVAEKLGMRQETMIERNGRDVLVFATAKPSKACETSTT